MNTSEGVPVPEPPGGASWGILKHPGKVMFQPPRSLRARELRLAGNGVHDSGDKPRSLRARELRLRGLRTARGVDRRGPYARASCELVCIGLWKKYIRPRSLRARELRRRVPAAGGEECRGERAIERTLSFWWYPCGTARGRHTHSRRTRPDEEGVGGQPGATVPGASPPPLSPPLSPRTGS